MFVTGEIILLIG